MVEGETEVWYLQMYRQHEQKDRNARINIKPEIPQKKKIKDQYKLVKELARSEYDKVFWIVDLDVIVKETNDYYKNYQEVLGELRVHLRRYEKTRRYFAMRCQLTRMMMMART